MLEDRTALVQSHARLAADLLAARGFAATSMAILTTSTALAGWGTENAAGIRWRASAVHDAQGDRFHPGRLLRAEFAGAAVFTSPEFEQQFLGWSTSRQRVQAAIHDISRWLDQGWRDWDVTNSDLHNVWATLQTLESDQLDQVIGALAPRRLKRWIDEMGHGINGLSRSEKQELFSMLAGNASGEPLAEVYEAIVKAGRWEDAIDLGGALRQYASESVLVDFVVSVVALGLLEHRNGGVAVGMVLDGISGPAALDAAIEAIVAADGVLEAILVDGVVAARAVETGTACVLIDPAAGLIRALTRSNNAESKSLALLAIGDLLGTGGSALRALLDSRHGITDRRRRELTDTVAAELAATELTRRATRALRAGAIDLLLSDTDRMITALATRVDPQGSQTTALLADIIDQQLFGELGRIVWSLRGGEVVDQTRFSDRGTTADYPYPHAQNLAFFAGALNNALDQYAADAKRDINLIDWAAKLAGLFTGPLAQSTSYLGGLAGGAIAVGFADVSLGDAIDQTKGEIDDALAKLTQIVVSRLRPQLPTQPNNPNLGEAMLRWLDRYEQLYPQPG
ncbi:MAG: hypothetical protein QNJ77_03785 [Acidimicrobiia bacterium]|nr:hypothetical protein [Acidimicrobiia bacterium]